MTSQASRAFKSPAHTCILPASPKYSTSMHCELVSTFAALLFSEVNAKAVDRRTFFRAQLDDHAPRDVHMSNIATAMHLHEFKQREAWRHF